MLNSGREESEDEEKKCNSVFPRQLSSMQSLETLHLSNTKRTMSNVPAILETLPHLAGMTFLGQQQLISKDVFRS
jgi:hypothetical protein